MSEIFSVNGAPLLAFCWFAWVGAVTPGPNTLLALATAANFGARGVRGHLIGVSIGTTVLMASALTGMYSLIAAAPALALGLKWVGVAWLVWMGVSLMRARQTDVHSMVRPPRAYESALLQLGNGKGWMLVTATAAAWRGVATPAWLDVLLLTAIYVASCALALVVWAVAGQGLSEWLRVGHRAARFNAAMGASLVATALWMALQ